METLIAACGLDCAQCEAYIATQADDLLALESVAAKWTREYNAPGLTADNVRCDGCMSERRKVGHCFECKIRLCAVEHKLDTCASCPEYACDELEKFLKMVPPARENLEALRKTAAS